MRRSTAGWRLSFARGLVALFLGTALLVAGAGQSRLATYIGVYWLLGAVLTIRWLSRSRGIPGRRMGALAAAIGALAGVTLLAREPLDHLVGTGTLLNLVGAGAIATGTLRMLGGFRDARVADGRTPKRNSIFVGALDAGLGLGLVLASGTSSTSIRFVAAAWGLVGGTLLLADALRMRRCQTGAGRRGSNG
jgi:uncharacterized membrane protein HdeD (DUF308 family)